jgi:hypothetical protein
MSLLITSRNRSPGFDFIRTFYFFIFTRISYLTTDYQGVSRQNHFAQVTFADFTSLELEPI